MIDKWIIKTDGVLKFNSLKVCTESQYNKMTAGVNQQRIVSWCADNHCTVKSEKREQYLSILTEAVSSINESEARNVDILHDKFLEFVDSLPEVNVEEKKEPQEQDAVNFLTAAKDIIIGINNGDIDGAVLITQVGPIGLPCGNIPPSILKELFELYVDKYEHKDN